MLRCATEGVGARQEALPLLTRRSARPSLDMDSAVSLARADSAIATGICLAKCQGAKLQRCPEGTRLSGSLLIPHRGMVCFMSCIIS